MKHLILLVFICLGQIAFAQETKRPEWFFNQDCVLVKDMLNKIRENPTREDFDKYQMDSIRSAPLEMNYTLCDKAKKEVNDYLYHKDSYQRFSCKLTAIANGFTEKEAIDQLLDTKEVSEIILNTSKKIGLYVMRTDFHGKNLFYIYIIVPHGSEGDLYTRIK